MSGRQSTTIALLDDSALGDRAVLDPPPRPGAALRQAGGRRSGRPCRSRPRRRRRCARRSRARYRTRSSALDAPRQAVPGDRPDDACRLPRPRRDLQRRGTAAHRAPAREHVPLPTIREVVLAVAAARSSVRSCPFENSLEGSVNEAVDALAARGRRRAHHRRDRSARALRPDRPSRASSRARRELVLSHPQALAQCARFLRDRCPAPRREPPRRPPRRCARRSPRPSPPARWDAARRRALRRGGPARGHRGRPRQRRRASSGSRAPATRTSRLPRSAAWKSSVVFSGDGDGTPGWLVRLPARSSPRAT